MCSEWLLDVNRRLEAKVMQRDHAGNKARERRGNLRLTRAGDMFALSRYEAMNGRVEGFLHSRRVAGEVDKAAAGGDLVHGEAVQAQPCAGLAQARGAGAKARAELRGCKPLMVER